MTMKAKNDASLDIAERGSASGGRSRSTRRSSQSGTAARPALPAGPRLRSYMSDGTGPHGERAERAMNIDLDGKLSALDRNSGTDPSDE